MKDINQLAIKAALEAGKAIREVYSANDLGISYKDDESPLTIADQKAHHIITDLLEPTGYPIMSEEGAHTDFENRKNWESYWLVDPLDGTKEFIKKNKEFTVNIALIKNGQPVMGVIYTPVIQDLYYTNFEHKAFKVENIVEYPSEEEILEKSILLNGISLDNECFKVVASVSHLNDETKIFIDKLKNVHGRLDLVSVGSSLKFCLLAEGKADLYPRLGPTMEWDTAAGHAIAESCGFQVLNFDDKLPVKYNKENLLNPNFIVERKN